MDTAATIRDEVRALADFYGAESCPPLTVLDSPLLHEYVEIVLREDQMELVLGTVKALLESRGQWPAFRQRAADLGVDEGLFITARSSQRYRALWQALGYPLTVTYEVVRHECLSNLDRPKIARRTLCLQRRSPFPQRRCGRQLGSNAEPGPLLRFVGIRPVYSRDNLCGRQQKHR